MKELYGEGPASHTDPESCVVSRKAGHDALKGHMQAEHRAAKYLEIFLREPDARHAPVRFGIRMPTLSNRREGNTGGATSRAPTGPARSRPPACMEPPRARTGRP
jgi:hypothetical protein